MKLVSYVHSFCSLSLFLASVQARNHRRGPIHSHLNTSSHAGHENQLVCEIVDSSESTISTPSTINEDAPTNASPLNVTGGGIVPVAPPRPPSSMPSVSLPSSSSSIDSSPEVPVQQTKWATNATLEAPAKPATNDSTIPIATSSNSTTFLTGACVGTLPRAESIPGRTYYDITGKTQADPLKTLASTGMNAVRVGPIERGQCLGPTDFSKLNNQSTLPQELNFELDFGCVDVQVQLAAQAVQLGMRVVLTLNMGVVIPRQWEMLGYKDMVAAVQKETKRQVGSFLEKAVVPDIVLFDNEGTDGCLFKEESTGHVRGMDKSADLDKELCGLKPTGNMASFPQLAGYYKARVIAVREAIKAAGRSDANVRFGLHSHGQYVDWKEGTIHGENKLDETKLVDSAGKLCAVGVEALVPEKVRQGKVDEILTIAGFSAYPDPMTPANIDDQSSRDGTFNRLRKTLGLMEGWGKKYGRYENGPFKGQLKLQALGVEYATAFDPVKEVKEHVAETEQMWGVVAGHEIMMGMLWWEPWYCRNNWEGGKAALCRHDEANFWPTYVMTAFGKGPRGLVASK